MRVVPYSEALRGIWDDFTRANSGAPGHLSGVFGLEAERFAAHNHSLIVFDGQKTLAILPLFLKRRPLFRALGEKILYSGGYFRSGPLFSRTAGKRQVSTALAMLVARTKELGREEGCDRIQVSYPMVIGEKPAVEHLGFFPLRPFGFSEDNVVSTLIDLTPDQRALFDALAPKNRNRVRRCEREGATFRVISDRSEWLDSYQLNEETLGHLRHSRREMELIWDTFVQPGVATVSGTMHEGRLTSVVVAAGTGASCYYWLGFSSRTHLPGANNFAMWNTMLLWKERGARFFEMGSMEFAGGKQQRISDFKESFGGKPYYGLGGYLVLKPTKRAMVELVRATASTVRRRRPRPTDVSSEDS